MDRYQKIHHQHLDSRRVEAGGFLTWVDASRFPLADVVDDEYVIFEGYEKLRLFAIATRGGWEYHAGSIDEDGTILSVEQDSTGRLVWDVDFYVEISEPNI